MPRGRPKKLITLDQIDDSVLQAIAEKMMKVFLKTPVDKPAEVEYNEPTAEEELEPEPAPQPIRLKRAKDVKNLTKTTSGQRQCRQEPIRTGVTPKINIGVTKADLRTFEKDNEIDKRLLDHASDVTNDFAALRSWAIHDFSKRTK